MAVNGHDIRFMKLAEAGHLLVNSESSLSLGFVSAVQRGYDVVITLAETSAASKAKPEPVEPSSILDRLDAEISHLKASTEAESCSFSVAPSRNSSTSPQTCASPSSLQSKDGSSEKSADHIALSASETMGSAATTKMNDSPLSEHGIAGFEDGCKSSHEMSSKSTVEDELRLFYARYAPSKVVQVDAILATHPEYRDPAILNGVLREKYDADLSTHHSQSHDGKSCTCGASGDRTREENPLIKQLLDQNQTLIDSLHEVRVKLSAAETRADSLEEAARNSERRAKAAEARLAVIKSELGSLKEQGKLEEPATKIHDSMLTPRHIPEKPLLQNRAAPQTQHAQHVAGSLYASMPGRHGEMPRTASFAYMSCLGAYPPCEAGNLEIREDPLAFCPQPATLDVKHTTQAPPLLPSWNDSRDTPLKMDAYISQGDMLVTFLGPFLLLDKMLTSRSAEFRLR